jgi:hypothetical protein
MGRAKRMVQNEPDLSLLRVRYERYYRLSRYRRGAGGQWGAGREGIRYIPYSRLSWAAFKDPEWRLREQRRFDLNEYEALPWDLPVIEDHYAHVSVEDGAKVAFTPSA